MKKPRVLALMYDFLPESSVDYSNAEALNHQEEAFDLSVANGVARFDMKAHVVTEPEARQIVGPFIEKWRVYARLQPAPQTFELKFKQAIWEERDPPSPRFSARAGSPRLSIRLSTEARRYPAPPQSELMITPDVQSMHDRFVGSLEGKEPLTTMAYFCLTVLEGSTGATKGRRKAAARMYRIENAVLRQIGFLSEHKGGSQARKQKGTGAELNANEVEFLRGAVGAIILRMAEMAADPDRDYAVIRMSDP